MLWRRWFAATVLFLGLSQGAFATHEALPEEAGGTYVGADICSECHEDKFEQILPSKHAQMSDLRTPFAKRGCETCHGAGEAHALSEGQDFTGITAYGIGSRSPAEKQNKVCLSCHQDTGRMHWQGSAHEAADVACTSCHLIHQPDGVLHKAKESDVCTACHTKVRADLHKASAHPVRQGQITCTDCHSPHGSVGPKSLEAWTVNQNCYQCHAEKRGPFLWEHEPVTEECTACHTPHGSNNPAMLQRRPPMLCQQCHQVIGGAGGGLAGHINDSYEWGGGGTRFLLGESCLNCHSQVHGSNHPSGAALQR
jgi:DmsE family decaheme c-type cytochrome